MAEYSGIYQMYEGTKDQADSTQQNRELVYVNTEDALRLKTESGDYKYFYAVTLSSNLTSGEIAQLQNIDAETISNTQWGYLGTMSGQPLESETDTLDNVVERNSTTNREITAGGLTLNGNASISGDLEVYDQAYFNDEYSNTVVASGCTIEWQRGNKQKLTLDDDCEVTFVAPSGVANLLLHVVQDASGEHSLTFADPIKWANGTTPSLTTSGNSEDILTFYYNNSDYYGAASLNFS